MEYSFPKNNNNKNVVNSLCHQDVPPQAFPFGVPTSVNEITWCLHEISLDEEHKSFRLLRKEVVEKGVRLPLGVKSDLTVLVSDFGLAKETKDTVSVLLLKV